MSAKGSWYGDRCYFGMHYDMHVRTDDTDIGARLTVDDIAANLKAMKCDWVQTDCKGHPGVTGWKSTVPAATVNAHIHNDMMTVWRAATKRLKLPLHCHYSGIIDHAAAEKFPAWKVVPNPSQKKPPEMHRLCPRSPYLDELLIPQMKELIDRYDVDGFWVDGDLWGVDPCYCSACRRVFTEETGIIEPPVELSDANWPLWMKFHRASFDAYVKKYCDAVHAHRPGVRVCSNWLQTFGDPGEPTAPTDWISGDNTPVFGLDSSRCEARFISTREKPWDIMLWNFYCSGGFEHLDTSPWTAKPAEMLMQEAAVSLAFGGHVQIYESPQYIRDGRLVPWRSKRIGEAASFIKARRAVCSGTETIPQIAVLHSEHHYRSLPSNNLHWGYDADAVRGAVFSILESSYGVDVLDEWALFPHLADFPVVVIPEQYNMSNAMVNALKQYAVAGGRLLVAGAKCLDRFGAEFFGVKSEGITDVKEKVNGEPKSLYPFKNSHFCVSSALGVTPVFSKELHRVIPAGADAHSYFWTTPIPDDDRAPFAAATVYRVGKGYAAYIPFDVFKDFKTNRYIMERAFIGEVIASMRPDLSIRVKAPAAIDVVLRKKGTASIVHFINRASGIPNQPNNGVIDEIPGVGPMTITAALPRRPKKVELSLEKGTLSWKYTPGKKGRGVLSITLPRVHIHAAVLID
ncbi:MAG: alpha-L-fucosidase [Spirochaetota bacterium]